MYSQQWWGRSNDLMWEGSERVWESGKHIIASSEKRWSMHPHKQERESTIWWLRSYILSIDSRKDHIQMWRTQWLSTRTNTLQGKGYLFTVSHFVPLFFWIPWRTIWSWFVEFVIFLGGTLSLFQLNISVYWTSWILLLKKLANKSHIHCRHWDKFTIQFFLSFWLCCQGNQPVWFWFG